MQEGLRTIIVRMCFVYKRPLTFLVSRRLVDQGESGGQDKVLSAVLALRSNHLQQLLQLIKVSFLAHPVRLVDGQISTIGHNKYLYYS